MDRELSTDMRALGSTPEEQVTDECEAALL